MRLLYTTNSDLTRYTLQLAQLRALLLQPLPSAGLIFKKWTNKQRQGPMSWTSPPEHLLQWLRRQSSGVNAAETLEVSCVCPPSLQSCAVCACIPPFIVLLFGLQRQRALNAELGVKGVLGSRADLITWLEEAV